MDHDTDTPPARPSRLGQAASTARLHAEALLWPLAERAFYAALTLMQALNARHVRWATPARYFRVGFWASHCSREHRRASVALWRSASGFPAPGFSARAQPHSGSAREMMASEALNQADTPWFEPAARADLLWALSERARMLSNHPARLFGAAATLDAIPPQTRDLDSFFRSTLEDLSPGWADLDVPANDMIGQRMLREEDLHRSVERARRSQRSFLEARGIAGALDPKPNPNASASVPRL